MLIKTPMLLPANKRRVLTALFLFALVVIVISYEYYLDREKNILQQKHTELTGIANLKISEISRWYKDELQDIQIIFDGGYLSRFLNQWIVTRSNRDKEEVRRYITSLKQQHDYQDIFIISTGGEIVISTNIESVVPDSIMQMKLRESIRQMKVVSTDLHRIPKGNKIYLDFLAPVLDKGGRITAVIVFRIDPEKFLFPTAAYWPVASRTSETVLLRNEGGRALVLNGLRNNKEVALNLSVGLVDTNRPAVRAITGYTGIFQGVDYRREEVLAHLSPIPGTPWYIVVKVDKSEIYSDLYKESRLIAVVTTMLIMVVAFGFYALYSRSQKNLYSELLKTEENYRDMFANNPLPMWIYDLHTLAFLEVNESSISKYGYSRDEFLSMKITDILQGEDIEKLLKDSKFTGNDYISGTIWRHVKKGGEVILAEVRSHHILFNGRPASNVLVTDMTEVMRAVEALRVSEQRFREMFENHSAVMLFVDPENGKIIDANNAAGEYYGYPLRVLKDMSLNEINTASKSEIMSMIKSVRDRSKTHFETQHRLANGTVREVEIFSSNIHIGGRDYLYSIIQDITERKRAEFRIKLLSKSIEQSPVSVVITDPQGVLEYVNPKFSEVTGYSPGELIGRTHALLKSNKQSNKFYEEMWDTILSGKDWKGEFHNKKKNGELFWENAVISAIVNENGDITHFVGIKEDITKEKQMFEELLMAKEKAEEMNRIKSSFFANMSHELRTPLIGILGYAEILQDELPEDGDLARIAHTIEMGGLRLLKTLNLILNLSKIESHKYEIKIERTEIVSKVRETFELFISVAKGKKIGYSFNPAVGSIYCDIDSLMFDHIISNLINNALKYTKQGAVLVSIFGDPENAYIEVKDTGIGIPKDMQQIIWDEFRQVSEGLNRTFEGTGLGLTIAKKYTEFIGGQISVESEEGQGSTFRVQLPLSEKTI